MPAQGPAPDATTLEVIEDLARFARASGNETADAVLTELLVVLTTGGDPYGPDDEALPPTSPSR